MVIAVSITAAAVYLPTLGADFVYDDIPQIVIDNYIHKAANLGEVLSFRVLQRDVLDHNRPIMLLSLMIDSMLWGHNPVGYHLSNLLLHVLCTALLLLLLLGIFSRLAGSGGRTTRPFLGALFGAMLFAVHPANTEAVCVVSFREDILVAFFTLIGLSLAQRFPTQRKLTTVLLGSGCALSMLAAVASKESGAVVPALLLIYWLVVRQRTHPREWITLIAVVFAVTVGFLAARFACEPGHSVIFTEKPVYPDGSFSKMLRIQPRIWAFQLGVLFRPDLLCADKTGYTIRNVSLTTALLVLAVTAIGTFVLARRNSAVGLGAAFYWLALLPVSNLTPIYRPMADRYLYFPMVGVCLAVGAIIWRLKIPQNRWMRTLLIMGAAAACSVLGVSTVQQTRVWQNERSLWETTVEKNPYSFTANNNLGLALFDDGEFDKAVEVFKQACNLSPGDADPWARLAITYDAMQMPNLAEEALRQAAARDQRYTDPALLVESLTWEPRLAKKLQTIADRTFKH